LKLQKFIDSNFITMSRRDVRQQRKRAEATRGIKAPHTTKKHQVLVKKKNHTRTTKATSSTHMGTQKLYPPHYSCPLLDSIYDK
jgi:hypothetical protein